MKGVFTQPDVNGVQQPADPTAVFFRWSDPAGNVTTWQYGVTGTIVKDSTGNYHADADTTLVGAVAGPGVWKLRVYATGTGAASTDFEFIVDDSPLK